MSRPEPLTEAEVLAGALAKALISQTAETPKGPANIADLLGTLGRAGLDIADVIGKRRTPRDRFDESSDTLIETLDVLGKRAEGIGNAITAGGAASGRDAAGGHVSCLTEAVMGVTAGLCMIANAINRLADAVENHGSPEQ